jgi:hypothetical protein
MHPLLASALILAGEALAQPSPAPAPTATPNDAARAFYVVYLAWRNLGIPPAASRSPLRPVLSAALAADLSAAASVGDNTAWGGAFPVWPRDVFTSLAEGAQRADVGLCKRAGDFARCDVTLSIRDPVSGIDHRWHDAVLVRRERSSWVVDDVAYGGRWPGANAGTLRANLKAFLAMPAPPPPPAAPAAPR